MGRYFMVSQNKSYREERSGGILFAPSKTKQNKPAVPHWATMQDLDPSDVIFCAFNGKIVSVAVPLGPSTLGDRPAILPKTDWADVGWTCQVAYHDLQTPIRIYDELDAELRSGERRFNVNGHMTEQYLVPVTALFAGTLLAGFKDRLPGSLVAPDAQADPSPAPATGPDAQDTDIERSQAEATVRKQSRETVAVLLAHGQLLLSYVEHIEKAHGYRLGSRRYKGPTDGAALRADAVDPYSQALIEAKPRLTTDEMYRALGQLTIYSQLDDRELEKVVLVGEQPSAWHRARLAAEGVHCVWADGDGFKDTAGGRFS
jgi:hypothetical protein